jgi:hypothetical protein
MYALKDFDCNETLFVLFLGIPPCYVDSISILLVKNLYVTFLVTAVKHLRITAGVFSESALRVTLQDVKKVNPFSVFLSSNFEFAAIKTTVFWDETPCNLVDRYQRFGGPTFLHIQGS